MFGVEDCAARARVVVAGAAEELGHGRHSGSVGTSRRRRDRGGCRHRGGVATGTCAIVARGPLAVLVAVVAAVVVAVALPACTHALVVAAHVLSRVGGALQPAHVGGSHRRHRRAPPVHGRLQGGRVVRRRAFSAALPPRLGVEPGGGWRAAAAVRQTPLARSAGRLRCLLPCRAAGRGREARGGRVGLRVSARKAAHEAAGACGQATARSRRCRRRQHGEEADEHAGRRRGAAGRAGVLPPRSHRSDGRWAAGPVG